MYYAHWEKEANVKKVLNRVDITGAIKKSGIPVVYENSNCYLVNNDAHTLVVGATGSGKTQSVILPLVKLSMLANESLIVQDVKGEIYVMTANEFKKRGYNVLVLKPSIDTKSGSKISCRIGLERNVDFLLDDSDSVFEKLKNKLNDVNCIFVDEAQFLTAKQVDELFVISKAMNIPVICYGLRTDFKLNFFEGSEALFKYADTIVGLEKKCSCGNEAIVNARYDGEKIIYDGDQVLLGSDDKYKAVCLSCYRKGILNAKRN